jgi:hypothetical protein
MDNKKLREVAVLLTNYQMDKIELYKRSSDKVYLWFKKGKVRVLDPEEIIEL